MVWYGLSFDQAALEPATKTRKHEKTGGAVRYRRAKTKTRAARSWSIVEVINRPAGRPRRALSERRDMEKLLMRQLRPQHVVGVLLTAWLAQVAAQRPAGPATVTLFEGARLITGDGGAPIEGSAFLVEGSTLHPGRAPRRDSSARRRRARRSHRQDRHPSACRRPLAHRLHEEPDERGAELHPRQHPGPHAPLRVFRRRGQPIDGHGLRRDAVSAP